VIDRRLKTLHVFTGLEIAAIPEGRKRCCAGVPPKRSFIAFGEDFSPIWEQGSF